MRDFLKKIKENFGDPKIIEIKPDKIKFNFLEKKTSSYESQKSYDWNNLESSIKKNGYDPLMFSYIKISNDNYCVNGHHRLVVLKKLNLNENIKVKKLKYKYWFIFIVILFYCIFTLKFDLRKK